MSKPELSIFAFPKGLGTIYKEQLQINVTFLEFNIPLTGSSSHLSSNVGGKKRIIMIQGAHDGTHFDGTTPNGKLGDFVYEIEQWVNQGVQSIVGYTDSFGVTYYVHCFDWMWVRSPQDPHRLLYTLFMVETASIV